MPEARDASNFECISFDHDFLILYEDEEIVEGECERCGASFYEEKLHD